MATGYRLMCRSPCSPPGGAVLGGCRSFMKSPDGEEETLVAVEVLQPPDPGPSLSPGPL